MSTVEILQQAVSRFGNVRILVIGDIIVDQFIWGTVSRISPEAPVPVVNVTREDFLLGGSANVLKNIYSLGGRGALCGVIGSDLMGDKLVDLVQKLPAPVDGLARGERTDHGQDPGRGAGAAGCPFRPGGKRYSLQGHPQCHGGLS